MNSLCDAIDAVERRRSNLTVYTTDDHVAGELREQFSTVNVDVVHNPVTGLREPGFVVVRGPDGAFRGALGLDQFGAVLSPEIHPPWELRDTGIETEDLFDFLENTLFAAYDRRQMLATTREIEDRAWRVGDGRLYTGFQRKTPFLEQRDVYERLAGRGTLSITVFIDDDWDETVEDVAVVSEPGSELGDFWFVVFDGGNDERQCCALLAEERSEGRYYGFWTYESERVIELIDHLERTYDVP
ncbi:DICT sensory domain-containing protein [Natrarchaeobius chitinivorans]|nr:DICT sensory domain-containing protein [Natrarchaeobius chitinivorans]